jgi:hypothetical protein
MRIPVYEADKAREYIKSKSEDDFLEIVTIAVKKIESEIITACDNGYHDRNSIVGLGSVNKTTDEIQEIVDTITNSLEDAGYKTRLIQIRKIRGLMRGYYYVEWY